MPSPPCVDINLFVYNGAATVGPAIESVLAQTWPAVALTLIDDGSTDGTAAVLADYAAAHSNIRLKHNRCNGGAIANFQRAFWFGDADFVMPKSGDDMLAPDFIERVMAVLLAHPGAAMCHAGGLVFRGDNTIAGHYPPEHRLHAVAADPLARAREVMARYTSSPSFWGIYRRAAVDRLSPIRQRAGWDHVLLAELALAGEIRHVPQPLYLRRDGGKPVAQLARAATEQARAGLPLDDTLAEQRWRTPLITTAYAHLEMAVATRLSHADRLQLMQDARAIFRGRWLNALIGEGEALHADLPHLLAALRDSSPFEAAWMRQSLRETLHGVAIIVPEAVPHHIPASVARLCDVASLPMPFPANWPSAFSSPA
jgi:glycosyltransferase involved in cell wall biosynthesis